MRLLKSIFRTENKTLKIWESTNKLRGEVYENGVRVKCVDFFNVTESFIRKNLGFDYCYRVYFERKNGRIVLNPINKKRRIIWSNDEYDKWLEDMQGEITEEEMTPEYYHYCCESDLSDERANLNVEVDGCIVAFANLGLWDGRHNGAKIVGSVLKDILYSNDDLVTWYCDVYNVKCDTTHHDGKNHILYRVAKNREQAETLVNKIAFNGMTEEQFRKATKSLRPYVAKVYGW